MASDHDDHTDTTTTARLIRGGISHGIIIVCVFAIPIGLAGLAMIRMRGSANAPPLKHDPASNANFNDVTVDHIYLIWNVDFEAQRISGSVSLVVRFLKRTHKLVLDGRDLEIEKIFINSTEAKFDVQDAGVLGQKIVIYVGTHEPDDRRHVFIKYSTGKGCTALQFLKAEQTVDKKGPYLFSQSQPIHARSLFPCMDTPAVKQTYAAKVTVPEGLTCLMSAMESEPTFESEKTTVFMFGQPIRVPSYLIAIVVGVLEKRKISDRCAVWSEPSVVDKALFEFSLTERMVITAEIIAGSYAWGRYDLVVLPASFPFGGMENPCLTFVTPSLLAGDRSLSSVIAHEIAHSWTGNLVTNANWEHFWLNEGFTVFLERKMIGRLESEEMRQLHAEVGWEDGLLPAVRDFTEEHPYTVLVQKHEGIDPDDSYSVIPYEKGSALLMYLEQQLGDKSRFEKFFKDYIKQFDGTSITTDDWLRFLYDYFPDKKAVLDGVDWNNWLHEPGIPKAKPKYDGSLLRGARLLANKWITSDDSEVNQWNADEFTRMSALEKIKVLRCIHAEPPMSEEKLKKLGDLYGLQESQNSEILFAWISIGLKARFEPIIPTALKFVAALGRLKFIRPIYKELFAWEVSAAEAIAQFEQTSPFMHPISESTIRKMIPT